MLIAKSLINAASVIHHSFRKDISFLTRSIFRKDEKLLSTYLSEHKIRGLHIGCGENLLPGFLNSDLFPTSSNIFHLDAARKFPLKDCSFDVIFSEHMIEHISYADGINMLRECHRILKPGGTIRISTPDIQRIISLAGTQKTEIEIKYIRWATEQFCPFGSSDDPTFLINNFFRAWGHQFIYSHQTLHNALEECDFTKIDSCELNQSRTDFLKNLENDSRMPRDFLSLETLTLEAVKPGKL